MKFKLEYSDTLFRLIVISSTGEDDYSDAVLYCSVSSVVGPDGRVLGVYLTGSEPELDSLSSHPSDIEMVSTLIKVYDLSAWPVLKPVDGTVTIVETEFDEEGDDGEEPEPVI